MAPSQITATTANGGFSGLRQYLPTGTDLTRSLNGRPRKTLGYLTPSEKLAELLAHTS
jgi:IS30 family transposase